MTIKEYIKNKVLGLQGLVQYENPEQEERMTFICDAERVMKSHIHEYNIWYMGDGDELLNYYTRQNVVDFNYEPLYSRNKRSYYWSISATENDIKRTHSGQPRNMVDTLVNILPFPDHHAGPIEDSDNAVNANLNKILKECKFRTIYRQEQLPMTLVEGWGAYKINWDLDFSDYPYPVYYRAENVDFIYKSKRIVGAIFKDFYTDGKNRKYMLAETRYIKNDKGTRVLVIEKELFRIQGEDYVVSVDFGNVPELSDTINYIEIEHFDKLFAVPCIIFEDTSGTGGPGRSIFTGKIDLFDDLDQCLSQASNAVRRSTVHEYFNSNFLERDEETGMPKQPKAYDRKYIMYNGQMDANGSDTASAPVQVTQPQVNFEQYSEQAVSILVQILNGIMSPATLGMDIAKKDNAAAQREKEKMTIFTRNGIIEAETEILKDLYNQLLCAYEFAHKNTITNKDYDISIKYSGFADDSFENKLEVLSQVYDGQGISDEMYMNKLYGDTLSHAEYRRELKWLKENHSEPKREGMKGFAGGGLNVEGGPGAEILGDIMNGEEEL